MFHLSMQRRRRRLRQAIGNSRQINPLQNVDLLNTQHALRFVLWSHTKKITQQYLTPWRLMLTGRHINNNEMKMEIT